MCVLSGDVCINMCIHVCLYVLTYMYVCACVLMHVCTDVCVLVFIHVYCCCIKLKDHEQMTFDYLSAYDTHCFGMYTHSVYTCVHTYNVRIYECSKTNVEPSEHAQTKAHWWVVLEVRSKVELHLCILREGKGSAMHLRASTPQTSSPHVKHNDCCHTKYN